MIMRTALPVVAHRSLEKRRIIHRTHVGTKKGTVEQEASRTASLIFAFGLHNSLSSLSSAVSVMPASFFMLHPCALAQEHSLQSRCPSTCTGHEVRPEFDGDEGTTGDAGNKRCSRSCSPNAVMQKRQRAKESKTPFSSTSRATCSASAPSLSFFCAEGLVARAWGGSSHGNPKERGQQ